MFYCYYNTFLGTRTLNIESQSEFNQNNKHYDSIISISTGKTSITAPEITESHTLVDITNIQSLSLQYLFASLVNTEVLHWWKSLRPSSNITMRHAGYKKTYQKVSERDGT